MMSRLERGARHPAWRRAVGAEAGRDDDADLERDQHRRQRHRGPAVRRFRRPVPALAVPGARGLHRCRVERLGAGDAPGRGEARLRRAPGRDGVDAGGRTCARGDRRPRVYAVMWLLMNVMSTLQLVSAFGLAGLVFDARQAKRLFPQRAVRAADGGSNRRCDGGRLRRQRHRLSRGSAPADRWWEGCWEAPLAEEAGSRSKS